MSKSAEAPNDSFASSLKYAVLPNPTVAPVPVITLASKVAVAPTLIWFITLTPVPTVSN